MNEGVLFVKGCIQDVALWDMRKYIQYGKCHFGDRRYWIDE